MTVRNVLVYKNYKMIMKTIQIIYQVSKKPMNFFIRPKYSPLGTKSRPIKIPTDKNRIKGLRLPN
jgi:hypothetical protein